MTYFAKKQEQNDTPPLDDWDDDDEKPNMVLVWMIRIGILLLILGGLGSLTLYFIPKAVGDTFTEQIVTLRLEEAARHLCKGVSGGDLRQLIEGDGPPPPPGSRDRDPVNLLFGRGIARGVVKVDSSYNPISSEYQFRMELAENAQASGIRAGAGIASAPITLKIKRDIFGFSACITDS